ncbi:MAG: hypothetical protein M3483_07620 [Gemmatimonadota bacterium]|nr:hypothetical protein [Gemmatimonadota bacterium]
MVTGTLRGILWLLSGLAVAWLLLGLVLLPTMGGMMGGTMGDDGTMGPGMMNGGMMNGGTMEMGGMGMGSMTAMMGMMGAALIALLGLAGIFVYLVVDSFRRRSS